MSWKFGGIYIKPGFEDPEQAIRFLQIDRKFSYETIRFTNVVNSSFENTAVGFINGVTLVHDNYLPYNNSYEADTFNDYDFILMDISKSAEIVSFFLDGTTESYGLNHFKEGKRIRRCAVMGREIILEEGAFTSVGTVSFEAKILLWLQEFTGIGFQDLLKKEDLIMYNFTDTGF